MWVIAHFSMLFDLPPAAAGEERSKWGHPTPRQRTASSALLPTNGSEVAEILPAAAGKERSKWGHPTPRQRTPSSALLPTNGRQVAEILPMPQQRTTSLAPLTSALMGLCPLHCC